MVAGRNGLGAIAVLATALVVAACSNAGATTAPVTAAPPTAAPPAATTPAAAGPTVSVATDAEYGAVLTGANGMSLYLFTNDKNGSSACVGDCAGTWPPLTVASAGALTPGTGVTGALGTISRADGSLQVTLAGAPLYYYSGDSAAGDTKGEGLFNKWYLVAPAGTAVKEDSGGGASPAASKCSGPGCY
jgi:predicted lipoprotein with Yx(FWY)xxD motif